MTIKITGRNAELFQENLTAVLNIACVVAGHGNIPTEQDIQDPGRSGRYWYRETDHGANRFQLYPTSNDWWANIRGEGENFIVLEFQYRYDRHGVAEALTNLLLIRFANSDFVSLASFETA